MTFAGNAAERLSSLLGIDTATASSLVADALDAVPTLSTEEEKMNAVIEVAVSSHFARSAVAAAADAPGHSSSSSAAAVASPSASKKRPRPTTSSSSSATKQQKTMGSYFSMPPGSKIKTQRTLNSMMSKKVKAKNESGCENIEVEGAADGAKVSRDDDVGEILDDDEDEDVKKEENGDDDVPVKNEVAKKENGDDAEQKAAKQEETDVPVKSEGDHEDDAPSINTSNSTSIKCEQIVKSETHANTCMQDISVDYSSKDFDAKALAAAYISSGGTSPPFIHIAKALALVSSTTKRLEKERVLTNLLLSLLYYDRISGIEWDQDKIKSGDLLFPDSSVLHAALLCGNFVANGLVLKIGHSSISQAICSALSCSSTKLRQKASAAGEMGDAAADIFLGRDTAGSGSGGAVRQTRLAWGSPPKPLSLVDIINTINSLHVLCKDGGGKGVKGKRKDALYKVFSRCKEEEEIRFAVKIFCEHIRTGATLITVLRCLSAAHVLHENKFINSDWQDVELSQDEHFIDKQTIEKAQEQFRATYSKHHHLKECIICLVKYGLDGLSERCGVEVFCPLQPMLASPSRGINEVMNHYIEHYKSALEGDDKCDVLPPDFATAPFITAEYKYDGQRAQIHVNYNEDKRLVEVEIFSRHLDNMTEKFGQLVAWIRSHWPEDGPASFILDAEIVAVKRCAGDSNNKTVLLPFQVLSTMKRRSEESALGESSSASDTVDVCIFAFDILSVDGEDLISRRLAERRKILREKIKGFFTPGYFELAKSIDISLSDGGDAAESKGGNAARSDLENFLAESIGSTGRCEGLMLKSLHSMYYSHESREKSGGFGGWRKLKKDYVDDLADSIDVVPIGAWRGSGRKAKWFSPFLVAVYEPSTGEFQSLCRVMSGFSDEFYQEKYDFYSTRVLDEMPDTVSTGEHPPFWFEPSEVWEIRGADLTLSPVHHAALGTNELLGLDDDDGKGISLRFPRFVRTRDDKKLEEASTSQQILALFTGQAQRQEHKTSL